MSSNDSKKCLVEALTAYDEARLRGDDPTPVYDRNVLVAEGVSDRFERARQCLDLLASVCPRSTTAPDGAAPQAAAGRNDRLDPPLGEFGPFRLLEVLGVGGMGTVYRAWDVQRQQIVAVKVVTPRFAADAAMMTRYRREMAAGDAIKHPHLRDCLAACDIDGKHCLVLEYIDGFDLAAVVRRLGPLSVPDACEVVCAAADALHYAHGLGIVHRDVKPCNLILARDGNVKVLDLGLALLRKSLALRNQSQSLTGMSDLTSPGQIIGTADFMAPEQALEPHMVDGRTDVYALGCTLYYLLSGHSPFGGQEFDTPGKKMVAHVTRPLPPVRLWRPEIPGRPLAVLARATAKSPADRFDNAGKLAAALTPLAKGCDLARLAENMQA